MISCPNCGGILQVKPTCSPFISQGTKLLTEGFECSCGCHFVQEYQRNDDGYWTFYCKYVQYVDPNKISLSKENQLWNY